MIDVRENIKPPEPTAGNQSVIEVDHLFKSFGDNKVLCDFNMKLLNKENLAILGKSGSGKSVLIKCIIGLLQPEKGSIKILNQDILELTQDDLNKLRAKVGFLFQNSALYDSMTVRENLEFPLRSQPQKTTEAEVNDMVMEALTNVGLAKTVDMMPSELSGGMRKRISLARTLILKPNIILYDEPTTGLDPITGKEISELILEVNKKYNTASIIISHDISCIKITASRIILLMDGRCYANGTYEQLKESTDIRIKQFFE